MCRYRLSPRTTARITQLTSGRFQVCSEEICLPRQPTADSVGRIQGRLPDIVGAILSDRNVKVIETEAWPDFLAAGAIAADTGSCDRMLMTLGMGGAETFPSPRLVAAIEPLLQAHSRLLDLGLDPPRIVIFQAKALGHLVNKLDFFRASEVAETTLAFIEAYIRTFHPRSWSYIRLLTDDLDSMRELTSTTISPLVQKISPTDAMIRLARDRCSVTDAMTYGIAHAFQLQALIPRRDTYSSVFRPRYFSPKPSFVLAYGGVAERLFTEIIRHAIAHSDKDVFTAVPKMHVITRLGRKPAYAPYNDEKRINEEVAIADLENLELDGRFRDDWLAIRMYHKNNLNELVIFLESWRTKWTANAMNQHA